MNLYAYIASKKTLYYNELIIIKGQKRKPSYNVNLK